MDKMEIIRVLEDWNFWKSKPDTGILREFYVNRLYSFLNTDQILVITGARRSGKSFIMRQLAEYLINHGTDPKSILIINFEDPRLIPLTVQNLQRIYEVYLEFLNPGSMPYIFLDEIQEVENWEKWVVTMHELKKARIIISGSNAKLLSRELSTLLTGRHIDQQIFPLSFKEYLSFQRITVADELDRISRKIELQMHLRKYLEFGSFPGVVLQEKKGELLLNYYDDILMKDIIGRYRIRKREKLKSLAQFCISNISRLTTYRSIGKSAEISTDTAEKYAHYFENAYLFAFLKRFSFKIREQEKSPKKLYAIDTGLANMVGFRFSENTGHIIENAVFLEIMRRRMLRQNQEIYYWKDEKHHEIDFLIKEGFRINRLIQVCWNIQAPKVKDRELRSLGKALNECNLSDGFVITEDYKYQEVVKDKTIHYVPLWEWLLEN